MNSLMWYYNLIVYNNVTSLIDPVRSHRSHTITPITFCFCESLNKSSDVCHLPSWYKYAVSLEDKCKSDDRPHCYIHPHGRDMVIFSEGTTFPRYIFPPCIEVLFSTMCMPMQPSACHVFFHWIFYGDWLRSFFKFSLLGGRIIPLATYVVSNG